jgi:hypothetical protein
MNNNHTESTTQPAGALKFLTQQVMREESKSHITEEQRTPPFKMIGIKPHNISASLAARTS